MNKTDRVIPVLIYTMLNIINFNAIFIIKYMYGNVKIYSMFRFINAVFLLIPFKFPNIYISSPALFFFYITYFITEYQN